MSKVVVFDDESDVNSNFRHKEINIHEDGKSSDEGKSSIHERPMPLRTRMVSFDANSAVQGEQRNSITSTNQIGPRRGSGAQLLLQTQTSMRNFQQSLDQYSGSPKASSPHNLSARKPSGGRADEIVIHEKLHRQKSVMGPKTAFEMQEVNEQLSAGMSCEDLSPFKIFQNLCIAVFITIDVEQSSLLAKIIGFVSKMVVVIAVLAYIISTDPSARYVPNTCDIPYCNNDPMLCPGYMVCSDTELPSITAAINFTTYYFTAEYGLRLLTVWAVSSRVAGVIPASWESLHKSNPDIAIPIYSPWYQTFKFIFRFKNLVDLASILPSYTSYFLSQSTNTNFVRTLRLLRLVRVLRLMKLMSFLKNVDVAIDLILATLTQASLMLSVFLFFVMIIVILFGCLIYLAEQGTFTVSDQYPNGAYLHPTDDMTGVKVSNINSAVQGIYWAIGTATGNGNINPTTDAGKALQGALCFLGVLGLAFPVGVIGSELDRAYHKHFRRLVALSQEREKELLAEATKAQGVKRTQGWVAGMTMGMGINTGLGIFSDKNQSPKIAELVGLTAQEIRAYELVKMFRNGAERFKAGDFPLFPEGTKMAITQAQIIASMAAATLEEKNQWVSRLQRKYDRLKSSNKANDYSQSNTQSNKNTSSQNSLTLSQNRTPSFKHSDRLEKDDGMNLYSTENQPRENKLFDNTGKDQDSSGMMIGKATQSNQNNNQTQKTTISN